ncbi:MAG: M23 family metallopeptidase [Bacilli bacterium]|nr:M23 family metallopeptidase [Bacilli bacterium]
MEYKSVSKYLDKNNDSKKNPISGFFIKVLFCIIICLSLLVFLKYDKNGKQIIYKYLYENNITLPSINEWYKKHFGDILPFQSLVKDNTKLVFNEHLVYDNVSVYKNGIKLYVDKNYLIPIIESGIVVFIGNKEDYGKTVIIEQTDGVLVWYGNVDNINVSLYDYVSKGEYLAEANDSFYMVFQKDGKYIKYEDYLK